MAIRFFKHVPRQSLRLILVVLGLGVLLYFALTRTQVGRDGLRKQIEERFTEDYAGRLEIGHLTGDLAQTLYANDLRLFDPMGRLVVHIDSLVAYPNWTDLFRKRISVGDITLFRPSIQALYQSDSTWNIVQAFRKNSNTPASSDNPWSFESAEVQLIDGRIDTAVEDVLPTVVEDKWLLNFAQTQISEINVAATVEWNRDAKLIDVSHFHANVHDQDVKLDDLQGQLLIEKDRILIPRFFLQSSGSSLQLSGLIDASESNQSGNIEDLYLELDVEPSRLESRQLRRIIPRWPLMETVTTSLRTRGPLSELVVEEASLISGLTRIQADGTFLGLPDTLDFELGVQNSQFTSEDLLALLPATLLRELPYIGTIESQLSAKGIIHGWDTPDRLDLRAQVVLDLKGDIGHVSGAVEVTDRPDTTLFYSATLDADSLNTSYLFEDARRASLLNGRLVLQGNGRMADSIYAEASLDLRPSHFAFRSMDTLHLDLTIDRKRLEADFMAQHQLSHLSGSANLDFSRSSPTYRANARASRLDVGPLFNIDSLQTDLNTRIELSGSGSSWTTAQGTASIHFDDSFVWLGKEHRALPAHTTTIAARSDPGRRPLLEIAGDVLSLDVRGDVAMEPVLAVSALWGHVFATAIDRQIDKPYQNRNASLFQFASAATSPSLEQYDLAFQARTALQKASLDRLSLQSELILKRSDIISAFLPFVPAFSLPLHTEASLLVDEEQIQGELAVTADSAVTHGFRLHRYTSLAKIRASLDQPLEESLTAEWDIRADTAALESLVLLRPTLEGRFGEKQGTITFDSERHGKLGPIHLETSVDLLPEKNRIALEELRFSLGDNVWANLNQAAIDIYSDVIAFHNLSLVSSGIWDPTTQVVNLDGRLSNSPADTFHVELQGIDLRQGSDLLEMKQPLDGLVSGEIALQGLTRPQISGTLAASHLAFDHTLLGDVHINSQYASGGANLALDLTLVPTPEADSLVARYNHLTRTTQNRLHLSGTISLPEYDDLDELKIPGQYNLALDVDRASTFFLKYIFKDVVTHAEGAVSGNGGITGSFDRPIFDADLQIAEGLLRIPKFNLTYLADGAVRVDKDAIILDRVSVRDATNGSAIVSGNILFNDYRFFSLDLAGSLDNIQIIDVLSSRELPFYGSIWASGDATLSGPIYNAVLSSQNVATRSNSELYIPLTEVAEVIDPGFIIFADSTGRIPDVTQLTRRRNVLAQRPVGERTFIEGLEMDLNIQAPQGSTVHLVIDPLLGDVMNAVGSGRVQLSRREGEFSVFGVFEVDSGDYLFTAGDFLARQFLIQNGTISWDGDPLNARLDINGAYRTRASTAGLPEDLSSRIQSLIPLIVNLDITGEVATPEVDLSLELDRSTQETISGTQFLETYLNQPDRTAEHATSVLLTNSFLLTTDNPDSQGLAGSAFNSVSQLVSSQLNRYLSDVLPNADISLGVQQNQAIQDLDVTAGLALRLLNDRLVIRGEGIYTGFGDNVDDTQQQGLQGEFVVEILLNPSVSVEVFYRREGDVLNEALLTSTTGAGLTYQTQFTTWRSLFRRIFKPKKSSTASDSTSTPPISARDH